MQAHSPLRRTAPIANAILLVLASFWVFSVFSGPVSSADFWWHLKMGQYIAETRSLPSTDPFSFTTQWDPMDESSRRNMLFTLRQSWLAQILLFGVYRFFSFEGIVYLRALVLTSLLMLVFRGVRREGAGIHASLLLALPAVFVFTGFTPERPQLFSFLFFTCIVFLAEGFRKKAESLRSDIRSTVNFLLPAVLIMLLWANMHGGFFLGIVLLWIYVLTEFLKYALRRFGPALPTAALKVLGATAILSSLFAFINPNGFAVFRILTERRHGLYRYLVSETVSTVDHVRMGLFGPELIAFFFLLVLCTLFFAIRARRLDSTDAVLFCVYAGLGLYLFRLIPFFVPIGILCLARYRPRFRFTGSPEIAEETRRSRRGEMIVSLLLSFVLIFTLIHGTLFGGVITAHPFHRNESVVTGKYPRGAVQFLKETRLPGNLFNPLDWGGYLMWHLHPEYLVFVDGRGLREDVVVNSARIMMGSKIERGGMPEWKALLDYYGVSTIVTYSVDHFSGRLIPLVTALSRDPDWEIVYADDVSLVFVRAALENADILRRFSLPKERIWHEVIAEAGAKSRGFFSRQVRANFRVTIGDAYLSLGMYRNAFDEYREAWVLGPQDPQVQERLRFLQRMIP